MSRIGYIIVVDKNGDEVFSHKLILDSGVGNGDFFIPVSLPTGNYKLLGYTRWMMNFGMKGFFQSDIYVINPYKPIPEAFMEHTVESLEVVDSKSSGIPLSLSEKPESPFIDLVFNSALTGTRKKVTLNVVANGEDASKGNYSLSIRKMNPIPVGQLATSIEVRNRLLDIKLGSDHSSILFPEIRGEIISGRIIHRDTQKPSGNIKMVLSLPGEEYLFKVGTSNKDGKFYFILDREYDNTKGFIQLLSDDWENHRIMMDSNMLNQKNILFSNFRIPKDYEPYILERSIQNQIQYSFGKVRLDSILPAIQIGPMYRKFSTTYHLADYTRFNTLEETIIEVVNHVSIKRKSEGGRVFEIRPQIDRSHTPFTPLVFVDGLFLKEHGDIIDYDVRKIKSIKFSREVVMFGGQVFQGILSFETIDKSFYFEYNQPYMNHIELFKSEKGKKYFEMDYGDGDWSRIPDFRTQLLWKPDLDLSGGNKMITFYTSDIIGDYILALEGFTNDGHPVSITRKLVVE